MNTDKAKLKAYRAKMKRGEAAWQPKREPFDTNIDLSETSTKENYYDRVPGLKRVSDLQFGDVYRMHEGPDMDKFVQPHQNWRTFVGLDEGETAGSHILTSTRLGKPTDFHYSDIQNRRFETMDKKDADEKDIAY